MKKIITQAFFLLWAVTSSAQIMMTLNGERLPIAEIDSIVFCNIELPSATNAMENTGEYSIFVEALRQTGLSDSLLAHERDKEYVMNDYFDRDRNALYYPRSCNLGYTVFAEKDAVFNTAGINNFNDLVAACQQWYGNPTWYDLVKEQGISISTGTDYTNRWNVVNMFVAYHILRANIAVNELVYERSVKSSATWNYCFGYEPQAYYETMLPGTLMKVWQTNPKTTKDLWLNRYVKNNTLTDQYATFGSDAMHPVLYSGAKIDRDVSMELLNACVHSIDKVLIYDNNACEAQHERMRFHINQMLPELATNKIMRATPQEISALNNGFDGNRVAFPVDYFDNLRCYDENTVLRYCVMGAWRALESTQLQGWRKCDFAIRLPRVPSGKYEIRYLYPPMVRGGEIEFYIGNSSDSTTMKKLSVLDAIENPYDGNMGYEPIISNINELYNPSNPDNPIDPKKAFGIEAGKVMRQKGYMYAPASFSRGTFNMITDKLDYNASNPYSACEKMIGNTSCRTENGYGTMMLRYIIATVDIKQSEDCWLRIKNRENDQVYANELGWSLNFIELVPTDVADSETYMEDWY